MLTFMDYLKTGPLRPLKGSLVRIHLTDDAVPFTIHTPCQIPFAFRDKVKEELNSLVDQGIIIKPAGDKPSEWCYPLVVVAKNNAELHHTVDLTKLNNQVSLPTHPSPTLKPSAV